MKKYYALTTSEDSADLYIYGYITSWTWDESDVSAYNIVKELEAVTASNINVYINSYGGDVAEGVAIYHALKRHPAKVTTYCDGFACSAASVVFMSGDERVMGEASMLMIHNAWTYAAGNADGLRKEADDLDKISDTAANSYRQAVSISDEELQVLLDAESWITPTEAVEWGFATSIAAAQLPAAASMSAQRAVFNALCKSQAVTPTVRVEVDTTKMEAILEGFKKEFGIAKSVEHKKTYFNFGGTK